MMIWNFSDEEECLPPARRGCGPVRKTKYFFASRSTAAGLIAILFLLLPSLTLAQVSMNETKAKTGEIRVADNGSTSGTTVEDDFYQLVKVIDEDGTEVPFPPAEYGPFIMQIDGMNREAQGDSEYRFGITIGNVISGRLSLRRRKEKNRNGKNGEENRVNVENLATTKMRPPDDVLPFESAVLKLVQGTRTMGLDTSTSPAVLTLGGRQGSLILEEIQEP